MNELRPPGSRNPPSVPPPESPPPQDPVQVARRVEQTDAAVVAWRRTAESRRDHWNEAQAELAEKARQRKRQVGATLGGMAAGAGIVALVGIGIAIGTRVPRGPDPSESLVRAQEALESAPPGLPPVTVQAPPPTLPPAGPGPQSFDPQIPDDTEPPIAVNGRKDGSGDYYGAQFETGRSRVHVVFVNPQGVVWNDDDGKRWCAKGPKGALRSCRYARKLAPLVASREQPPGWWTVQACDGDTDECVDVYTFELPPTSASPSATAQPTGTAAAAG